MEKFIVLDILGLNTTFGLSVIFKPEGMFWLCSWLGKDKVDKQEAF